MSTRLGTRSAALLAAGLALALLAAGGPAPAAASCDEVSVELAATGLMLVPGGCSAGRIESGESSRLVLTSDEFHDIDCRVALLDRASHEILSVSQIERQGRIAEDAEVVVRTLSGRPLDYLERPASRAKGHGAKLIVTGLATAAD